MTSEVNMSDYINRLIFNNKEELARAVANNDRVFFSPDPDNPAKDEFISEDVLQEKVQEQSQETINWKELPTGVIYQILEVVEVDSNFGKSEILTLKNREGDTIRVLACTGLNKVKEPLERAFVRSTGFKVSKKS